MRERRHGRRRGVYGLSRPARAAWEGAGPEDKARAGTALRGEDPLVVEHDEAPVEQFSELDAEPGPAAAGARRQLHPAQAEAEPADLPFTDAQGLGHLPGPDPSRHHCVEQPDARRFLPTHRECLPWVHGRTLSRTNYGRTIS